MKRVTPLVIVVVVALITACVAITWYFVKMRAVSEFAQQKAIGNTKSLHIRGGADAPVTVEEFGDFASEACAELVEPLLEKNTENKVRVIFRHFPADYRHQSHRAACAVEAAGLQGKFWEMHDLLYRNQRDWIEAADPKERFRAYAGKLGLDRDRFDKDSGSEMVKERVAFDQRRGRTLGIKEAPAIFVNYLQLPPENLNASGLEAAIESALREPGEDDD